MTRRTVSSLALAALALLSPLLAACVASPPDPDPIRIYPAEPPVQSGPRVDPEPAVVLDPREHDLELELGAERGVVHVDQPMPGGALVAIDDGRVHLTAVTSACGGARLLGTDAFRVIEREPRVIVTVVIDSLDCGTRLTWVTFDLPQGIDPDGPATFEVQLVEPGTDRWQSVTAELAP